MTLILVMICYMRKSFWIKKIKENIPEFHVSAVLNKRSMAICFEISKLDKIIVRKMLTIIDWEMDEYFFQKDGLRQLGWCSHHLID